MTAAVIAADLGGTYTKFGVVAEDGQLLSSDKQPTPVASGPIGLVEWLAQELGRRGEAAGVDRFGVAVPGIIDERHGVVVIAPNVGWKDIRLTELLEQLSGLSGVVTHDVRAGGVAERKVGAGAGADDMMFIPIGTGVAAAIVVDGRMLVADGYAGEIGHTPVAAAGDNVCACKQVGCLETVLSGPGLRREYHRRAGIELADAPHPEVLGRRARDGDKLSRRVIETAALGLGQALVPAITLCGPERIVIGGGVSGLFDLITPTVESYLDDTLTFQRRPKLVLAKLGSQAGVVGAGLTGWATA
ncbi:ROK family protein [Microlunatus sp. Y2014]|uniref:ROK family protein n=1 Tax=Microlunatus sp. Y2014 TaxID=3418488 RepID=UPI003DA6FE1B